MAKKYFPISSDALIVLKPASSGSNASLGAGKEYHNIIGAIDASYTYLGSTVVVGYVARSVLKFNTDFTGMTSINSATLKLKTSSVNPGTYGGYDRGTHVSPNAGSLRAYRITKSWTEGTYGNDELFYGSNSTEWSTFSTASTDASASSAYLTGVDTTSYTLDASTTTSRSSVVSYDITALIKKWAPATVTAVAALGAGEGLTNYGILLRMNSEGVDLGSNDAIEFWSREAYAANSSFGAGTAGSASEWVGGVNGASAYIEIDYVASNPVAVTASPIYSVGTPNAGIATIVNLSDANSWESVSTANGQVAMPKLNWTYTDGIGNVQSKWQVKIYSSLAKTTTYYDSGEIIDAEHIADKTIEITSNAAKPSWVVGAGWSTIAGLVNGTSYWWSIKVWDINGLASSESTPAEFKVRWGQSVHEFDLGSGYSTISQLTASIPAAAAGTQTIALYRAVATAGVTTGAWSPNIGPLAGSNRYLQIMVRMSSNDGTKPTVSDIAISYLSSVVAPDLWAVSSGTLILDPDERRFGTKSVLWKTTGTGSSYMQPMRNATSQYDMAVLQNTKYTISAYVKPNSIGSRLIKLRAYSSDSSTAAPVSASQIGSGSDAHTSFTADNEGWYRMTYTFETDSSTTYVKPVIEISGTGSIGDSLWVDGVQFEEGTVVRSWTPGFVTQSVTLEGGGLSIDASKGAKMRLRGSTGGANDLVELGSKGLNFGPTATQVELYGTSGTLNVSGGNLINTNGYVRAVQTTSGSAVFSGALTADAADRIRIESQGLIGWADGTTSTEDTNLYRNAAGVLKTDGQFIIGGANSLYAARATAASATQTFATSGTEYVVALDTASSSAGYASYDPNSWFNNAGDYIAPTVAGFYNVSGCFAFTSNSTGFRELVIQVDYAANGTWVEVAIQRFAPNASQSGRMSISTNIYLAANSRVRMAATQTSGGSLTSVTSTGDYPLLSVARVGA